MGIKAQWLAVGAVLMIVAAASPWSLRRWRIAENRRALLVTVDRVTAFGLALDLYRRDHGAYPSHRGRVDVIIPSLVAYHRNLEPQDGWGTPFGYEGVADHYSIRSLGANQRSDGLTKSRPRFFDCDILYEDGDFSQVPVGITSAGGGARHGSTEDQLQGIK